MSAGAVSSEPNNTQLTHAQRLIDEKVAGVGDLPDLRELADGAILWKASLCLLHHLETKHKDEMRGKKVLELSSGAGHLATSLFKMGAHVTCTEREAMGCFDYLSAQTLKAVNNVQDAAAGGSIRAVALDWGADGFKRSVLAKETLDFDVVIMSELVYDEDSHDLLLETIQNVCCAKTVIWSIFCDRPWSFMFFAKMHDAGGFDVQVIPDEDIDLLGMEPDARVCMHRITVK